ncbi:sugar transferase [Rhizobiaceae bacterium]|nr:sugar transferase [Rhizobiaceae bacterium]
MRTSPASNSARSLLPRMVWELGGGLVVVCAAVLILPSFVSSYSIGADTTWNSLVVALGCITLGWSLGLRFHSYPGLNVGSSILWCYTLSFALGVGMLFVARIPYSSIVLAMAYAVAFAWFLTAYVVGRRHHVVRLAVVDGGRVPDLASTPDVEWTLMSDPADYRPSMGPVVADLRHDFAPQWLAFLARCALNDVPVYHTKQIWENLTGRVEIEHLSENDFGSLAPNQTYLQLKSIIDRAAALFVTPLVLLLLAVVLPAMWLGQGRPFFFSQKRIGRGGVPFRIYKLRTMVVRKDKNRPATADDEELRRLVETMPNDARITPVGRLLRRFRIDELPQLLNILKGEMSWIGPRPEAVPLSRWYEEKLPFYLYRHVVHPGITGWAQINLGHVTRLESVDLKLQYDFYYIRNVSAWLDLVVLLRTARIILRG